MAISLCPSWKKISIYSIQRQSQIMSIRSQKMTLTISLKSMMTASLSPNPFHRHHSSKCKMQRQYPSSKKIMRAIMISNILIARASPISKTKYSSNLNKMLMINKFHFAIWSSPSHYSKPSLRESKKANLRLRWKRYWMGYERLVQDWAISLCLMKSTRRLLMSIGRW